MKKLIKGLLKTYLVVTSTYFTLAFTKAVIDAYRKQNYMKSYVKDNKHYIDSLNQFSKMLREKGYFDKEV